ncbi:MAG: BrnT family toxin [Acidobacteria bacterium]|nr:BrnT family toxin [Acidobacteriota bacterium]
MDFEWDDEKDASNRNKHGVSFEEAMTVFDDPYELTIADPHHSTLEDRFVSIGYSSAGRLLAVGYTDREGRVRIINAREATPRERTQYESRRIL